MPKRMIFHAPYPIPENPTAASRLRPKMMRAAFEELGYQVFDLSGNVKQRRQKYRSLQRLLKKGVEFEFLYCENSTAPNLFADGIRNGLAPFLDYSIHRLARKHQIPVGVFYRDVYWKYRAQEDGHYDVRKALLKLSSFSHLAFTAAADTCQRFDLIGYRHNRIHFFLPSEKMGEILRLKPSQYSALPPGYGLNPNPEFLSSVNTDKQEANPQKQSVDGTQTVNSVHPDNKTESNSHNQLTKTPQSANQNQPASSSGNLRIFYVGALGDHYRIEKAWSAVQEVGARLRICTGAEHWEQNSSKYRALGQNQIEIVHGASHQLEPHYQWCNLTLLLVEPSAYRSFASPVKLFEYLGHGKPVLVSAGTNAARIVEKFQAGWILDYDQQAISRLLTHLQTHPEEIQEKTLAAQAAAAQITWISRAKQVAQTLSPTSFQ